MHSLLGQKYPPGLKKSRGVESDSSSKSAEEYSDRALRNIQPLGQDDQPLRVVHRDDSCSALIRFLKHKSRRFSSEVAGLGDEFCELFQVLLVLVVKAVLDGTIDIDNSNNLEFHQSTFPKHILKHLS